MKIIVHPPNLVRRFFPNFIWNIPSVSKKIYLSFDDGPIPELTPWILELLKKYNAKATFFCVGDNVRKYPEIYQQILNEGHQTGNHTYHHLVGWKTDNEYFYKDIELADLYIKSKLFRPPHGKLRNSQIMHLSKNRKIILWDVLTKDYDQKISPQQCFSNVLQYARKGSIIVFHDNIKAKQNMTYALHSTLDTYSQLGYTFEAISDNAINEKENQILKHQFTN